MQFMKLPKQFIQSRDDGDKVIKSKRHSLCLVVAVKMRIFPTRLNDVS